jgi:hypothetical protein
MIPPRRSSVPPSVQRFARLSDAGGVSREPPKPTVRLQSQSRQHRQNPGSGRTGYVALGGNRFDQARVIVLDVSDPCAHRPAGHFLRRKRRQQGLERGCIRALLPKPNRPGFALEDYRHTVVKFGAQLVRRGDNGEAAHPFARRRAPVLPQARKGHRPGLPARSRRAAYRSRSFSIRKNHRPVRGSSGAGTPHGKPASFRSPRPWR